MLILLAYYLSFFSKNTCSSNKNKVRWETLLFLIQLDTYFTIFIIHKYVFLYLYEDRETDKQIDNSSQNI